MQEVVLKLGGAKANGIVQQAKRAFIEDASAGAAKKRAKYGTILNGGLAATNVVNTATQAFAGHPRMAAIWGFATACFGTSFGMYLKEFMQTAKTKKETAKALKDIISKPEFADILKRYLRINGDKRSAIEEFVAKHTNDRNGNLAKILKDERKNIEALDKAAFQMPLEARAKYNI